MSLFKCKMCGGTLEINGNETVAECEYCGTKQTLPSARDDAMTNLFNRANNLRMKCEFDKALQLYEKIIEQNDSESEAHWGAVLCKYGIEYVEDPKTLTRIPTCHRTSFDAVTKDADYLAAIDYSDTLQQAIYEQEARAIDRIQKDILAVVANEKPFDVFICYKETDETGRRTIDSTIANDIYYQLSQEGFKVFYAAITLEDKLGQEYEPYIFAALNSAKVMLVLGTKPEYFNAVWVKNEWSRFMKLMKTDRQKLLIPCYRDMDAYDLPEEFAHLQSQDMGKIGFINDVVRGIKKVIQKDEPVQATVVKETVVTGGNANTEPLLKRAFMFLADGEWDNADEYCEKVLDIDPECAEAYLGKLMAEFEIPTREKLSEATEHINENKNYAKAYQFGDKKLKNELEYAQQIIAKEKKYQQAKPLLKSHEMPKRLKAIEILRALDDYSDSVALVDECIESIYQTGLKSMSRNTENDYNYAINACFSPILDYKDSAELIEKCKTAIKEIYYCSGIEKMQLGQPSEYTAAIKIFEKLKDYKDSAKLIEQCEIGIKDAYYNQAVSLMDENTNFGYESAKNIFTDIADWRNSRELIQKCNDSINEPIYQTAKSKMNSDTEAEYQAAIDILNSIIDYKDSAQLIEECKVEKKECIYKKAVSLIEENTSFSYESAKKQLIRISDWRNSKELIEYCETRIKEIQDEAEKQKEIQRVARVKAAKKAKRNAIIICSIALIVIMGISLFLFLGVPAIKRNNAEKLISEGRYDEGYAIIMELDGQEGVDSHKYERAKAHLNNKEYDKAIEIFTELGDYSDSSEQITVCKYSKAVSLMDSEKYDEALVVFEELSDYSDSEELIKECKYNKADLLMNNEKYDEAISFFEELGDYSDSKEQIKECKYLKANSLMSNKKIDEALSIFLELDNYKDSLKKVEKYCLETAKTGKVGDIVYFGSYEQDNDISNGKEPIKWIVLDKQDNKLLVISKYALDCVSFNENYEDTNWEKCSLRKWMNDEFMNSTFTKEEISIILAIDLPADKNPEFNSNSGNPTQDSVFILSVSEKNNYDVLACSPTEYAVARGCKADYDSTSSAYYCNWWLRTTGKFNDWNTFCGESGVNTYGAVVYATYIGVRPAMWIDLSKIK